MKTLWLAAAMSLVLTACGGGGSADAGPDGLVDEGGDEGFDGGDPATDGGDTELDGGDGGGGDLSPFYGLIIFNEVLIDGTAEGDPNGDGDLNPVEDQFVELVNVGSAAVGMAEFTLVEADFGSLPRHTFASGFVLDPGRAVVVFGGGDAPPSTASATFFAANAADPGIPFGLHLSTPSDDMVLLDADGLLVARFCYGAGGDCSLAPADDQSLTRSPDISGDFVPHASAAGAAGAFSPGTRVDGTAF